MRFRCTCVKVSMESFTYQYVFDFRCPKSVTAYVDDVIRSSCYPVIFSIGSLGSISCQIIPCVQNKWMMFIR